LITVELTGLKDIERQLEELAPKLAKRALKKALQAGIEEIGNEVMARTPVDTGLLRESVGTAITMSSDGQAGLAKVGFGKQDYIARFIEFGHRIVGHKPNKKDTGKHVPAKPFIRNAFDTTKDKAVEVFTDVIKAELEAIGTKK
jgi:HK97 gp10 family phage protein